MPKATTTPEVKDNSVEAKLDEIILHLKRLDARDRLRTWGGLIRTFLTLIPLIVFLASLWYVAVNGDKLMKQLADVAASAAADYTQNQSKSLYDEIMNKYTTPKPK